MNESDETKDTEVRDPVGGQPQEPVEERPNVSSTKPEEYPADSRAKG